MKTEFKDVAHLYKRCDVQLPTNEIVLMLGTMNTMLCWKDKNQQLQWETIKDCTPILKSLEDIAYEDAIMLDTDEFVIDHKIRKVNTQDTLVNRISYSISDITYLLSKGYDLFSLIPNGYAINQKDLK